MVENKMSEIKTIVCGNVNCFLIENEGKALIVGDALMNIVSPSVSRLYTDKKRMLESAEKISETGERIIYFGHGKPRKNRKWKTENTK